MCIIIIIFNKHKFAICNEVLLYNYVLSEAVACIKFFYKIKLVYKLCKFIFKASEINKKSLT